MRNLYRCWVQMMVLDLVVRTRRWDLQPSSRSPTRSMTSAQQRVKRRPGYVVSRTVHKEDFFSCVQASTAESAAQAAMVATHLGKTWGLSAADATAAARLDQRRLLY